MERGAWGGFRGVGRVLGAFLVLAVVLALAGPSLAQDEELNQIRQAIVASGAKWEARATPISLLPPEERRKYLGAREDMDPDAPKNSLPPQKAAELPASLDWRAYNGKNYVTPVRNQNPCGSCFVFGPVAALEAKLLIAYNRPGQDIDLSEQIPLSCSGAGNCADGGYANLASDYLRATGTANEACYPYTATNGACATACANWENGAYRLTSWAYANSGQAATTEVLKTAIQTYGPVVIWMQIYTDFYSYGGGVYQRTSGIHEGNHFVLAVGWSDTDQAFICKNSWNTTWGESGYFRIAYDQLAQAPYFGWWTYRYGGAVGPLAGAGPAVQSLLLDE